MKTLFTVKVPTPADIRNLAGSVKAKARTASEVRAAKREARRMIADFERKQLHALAAEIIKSKR